jgi:hypothetical protein
MSMLSDTFTALSELLSAMVETTAVCAVFCRLKICDVRRNVCLAVDARELLDGNPTGQDTYCIGHADTHAHQLHPAHLSSCM